MVDPSGTAWQRYLSSLPPNLAALHRSPPQDVLPLADGRQVGVPELLDVLREQLPPPAERRARALRADRHGAGLVAAAWRHLVYRQTQAVLTLLDVQLAAEAQPDARAALEHAIALQRLAGAGTAADDDDDDDQLNSLLDALLSEQQRRQRQNLDYLDELDNAAGGQHHDLLAETRDQHAERELPADSTRPEIRTAKSLFLGVPSGRHFYSVYARLSENSHAGLSTAAPYLVRALQDDDRPVVGGPEPTSWAETLAVLAWACWAADDAMRRFLVDGEDIAARYVPIMSKVGLATGTDTDE